MRTHHFLLAATSAALLIGSNSALGATCNWLGVNANGWNDSANWSCPGGPVNGDSLVFPDSSGNKVHSHNRSGLTSVLDISFAGCGYTISGGLGLNITSTTPITSNCVINGRNEINFSNLQLIGTPPLTISNNATGAGGILALGTVPGPLRWAGELRLTNGIASNNQIEAFLSELAASSSVTKFGGGFVIFDGPNNYSGVTTVESGTLLTRNPGSLGAAGSAGTGTIVRSGASLDIQTSVSNEFLTLDDLVNNGTRSAPNLIVRADGVNWSGPISLTGVPNGSLPPRSELRINGANITWTISGVISGVSEIRHFGNATSKLLFTAANSYSGETVIDAGTLGVGSAPGRLPSATSLRLQSGAKFEFVAGALGVVESIAGIAGTGDVILDANGQANARLVIDTPAGKVFDLSGVIGGAGDIPISIQGLGTQILSGANTQSSQTDVSGDVTVDVRGSTFSQLTMMGTSKLRSSAAATIGGLLFTGSTDTPRAQPGGPGGFGVLNIQSGTNSFNATGVVEFDVAGNSPGVNQDQLNYSSAGVDLNNTQLAINFISHLSPGVSATLINQALGNVTGTFAGFPNNSYYPSGPAPIKYQVKYNDGAGNVTITRLPPIAVAGNPSGVIGVPISAPPIAPSGGVPPYSSISISAGPSWLSGMQSGDTLILSGNVAGPPGPQNFTVNVVDAAGQTFAAVLQVNVSGGPGMIVVDTLSDPGSAANCSLRKAIEAINTNTTPAGSNCPAASPGSQIQFSPALFAGGPQVLTLSAGEILIAKDMIVLGPGARLLSIDAANSSRIFRVDDGQVGDALVEIGQLSLINGAAAFDASVNATPGGAIFSKEDLVLGGMRFQDNRATGDAAKGGAVAVFNANLGISGALFVANGAQSATSDSLAYGGAVYFNAGTLELTNSTFVDNFATVTGTSGFKSVFPNAFGGALYFTNGVGTIDFCTITNNSTSASNLSFGAVESRGGGVFGDAGTLNIQNSVIFGNASNTTGTARSDHPDVGRGGGSISLDYSLVGPNPAPGVIQTNAIVGSPQLLPLGSNGGATDTISFRNNSALRDSAKPVAPDSVFDQRGPGFARQVGTRADVGALEQVLSLSPMTGFASGTVGVSYSGGTVVASGGSAPYTYAVVGSLPPGLSLDLNTGVIAGTPSSAVGSPFLFEVEATDSSVPAPQRLRGSYGISITAAGGSDFSWNGSVDTNWFTGANWTPFGPPGPGSIVRFPESAVAKVVTNVASRSFDLFEIGGGYTISGASVVSLSNAQPLRFSSTGMNSALRVPLILADGNAVVQLNADSDATPEFELGNSSGDLNFLGNVRFEFSNVPLGSNGRVRFLPHFQSAAQPGNVSYETLSAAQPHEVVLMNNSNYAGITSITGPNLIVRAADLTAPFGDTGAQTITRLTDAVIELENTSLSSSNSYIVDRERLESFSNGISHLATLSSKHTTAGSTIQWAGPLQYSGGSGAEFFNLTASNGGVLRIATPISGSGELRIGPNAVGSGLVVLDAASSFVGGIEINPNQVLLTNNSEVIPDSSVVTMIGDARLDLNGNQETISALSGSDPSSIVDVAGNSSTVGRLTTTGGTSSFAGQIIGSPSGPNLGGGYRITGGNQELSGTSTFSEPAVITGGTLILTGSLPDLRLDGGALRAQGFSAALNSLAPLAGGGILDLKSELTVATTVELSASVTVQSRVDSDISGAITVDGDVTLGEAILSLEPSATPIGIGNSYDLIDITGAGTLTGVFAGVTDNAIVSAGGLDFRVNYTSKKVTITRVPAAPTVIEVDTFEDPGSPSECSLRQALLSIATGATPPSSSCAPGAAGATIIFNSQVFGIPQTISLSGGEGLAIEKDLIIQGPGARLLTIDALNNSQVFLVDDGRASNAQVEIYGLNLINGLAASPDPFGGAISSNEDLVLGGVRIGDSEARYVDSMPGVAAGGAIKMGGDADLSIFDSLLVNNVANSASDESSAQGGAIFLGNGLLTMENTTLNNNQVIVSGAAGVSGPVAYGGAIYIDLGAAIIRSSTIVGNLSSAINAASGPVIESAGAGIFAVLSSPSSVVIENSVLKNLSQTLGSARTDFPDIQLLGTGTVAADYSYIEFASLPVGASATNRIVAAPLLGTLANNGGETDTISFLNASSLRDAGDPAASGLPPFDQRGPGFPRIAFGTLDVGAYEQALLLTPLSGALAPGVVGASYPGASVTATGGTGPYTYAVVSGSLPTGLTLAPASGLIAGTPSAAGTFSFQIEAIDSSMVASNRVSSDYSIVVSSVALPTLSVANASVSGDNALTPSLDFVVSLSAISATDVTVLVDTNSVDAEVSDFTAITMQTATITAGNLSTTVAVAVAADTIVEPTETVQLLLSSPVGATLGTSTGTGTIANDDVATVSISATSSALETANADFTVSTSNAIEGSVGVSYDVLDGDDVDPFQNATGGADFAAGAGSTSISSGSVSGSVTVLEDALVEAPEKLRIVLTGVTLPAGIAATDVLISTTINTHRHTILNNDVTNLSSSVASIVEGNAGTPQLSFTLTLSVAAAAPVSVLASTGSFGTNPADVSDFTVLSAVNVNFAPGVTSQTVTVDVQPDDIVEANETLQLLLTDPALPIATITTPTALGTITNDDSAVVSVNSASVLEGNVGTTPMNFQVSLSQRVQGAVSVSFTPVAVTATAGVDFDATPNTVNVASLTSSAARAVSVIADTQLETDETFSVVLGALTLPPGITSVGLSTSNSVGTILDDDAVGPSTIVLTTPLPTIPFSSGITYPVSVAISASSRPAGTATVTATRLGTPSVANISCALPLSNGSNANELVGSCNLAPTSPGVWATTIDFTGSSGFANATLTQNAVLTATLAPLTINQSSTTTVIGEAFTVTVQAGAVGGGPLPTGTVTVTQFPGSLQTVGSMVAGSATVNLVSRSPVVKGLLVSYSDPTQVYGSLQSFVDHTTNPAATAMTIALSALSGPANQPVNVNYTLGILAPGAVPSGQSGPAGQVQVTDGITSATCALAFPTGSCALAPNTPGARQITARFLGEASYLASTSAPSSYTVNQGGGTVDLVASVGNGVRVITGNNTAYTIVISNIGNVAVGGVTLSNPVPVGAISQSFTCIAGAGSSCGTGSSTGALNQIIQVGAGSSVSYLVTVSLASNSETEVSSTVSATVPVGVTDANPANNSATDTDLRGIYGEGFESEIE